MKRINYTLVVLVLLFSTNAFTQANTSLSNLGKTSINRNLDPKSVDTYNLGSTDSSWHSLFLAGAIYLDKKRFVYNPGTENNFVGTLSGNLTTGTYNTGLGFYSLTNNTTGSYNTAVGDQALYSNQTGWENTAVGKGSLFSNTGYYNTATGYAALNGNTNGDYNTALGVSALVRNTSANYNTAVGADAMYYNSTGINNTATGAYALFNNTDSYNTGIGFYALEATTASEFNTAIGFDAGDSYNNGYNNVFVGANTDVNGAGYYNVIAIGQGTICTGSSQVTMGNGATAEYRAYANWSNISDGRFKKNIKQNVPGLAFINKLQPVTYNLDATGLDKFLHADKADSSKANDKVAEAMNKALAAKEKVLFTGFVAQDVEKAAKSLNYDFSGVDAAKNDKDVYGLRYAEFVVPLVKAVQELSKMNDAKDSAINSLQSQVNELRSMIVASQSSVNSHLSTELSSASLQQNIPNPFSSATTISYSLPQTYSSAKIIIYNSKGVALKQISLTAKGNGTVNLDASTLASGAYQYSLYVDGKMIDTKQMIASK